MKMILIMSMMISIIFIFMKHPLSMGMLLMMQTILSCMINGLINMTYMISYILFLIFVGGMLVLFMYMASIASNEKFIFSMKLLIMFMIMFTFMTMKIDYTKMFKKLMTLYDSIMMNNFDEKMSLMKMFNFTSSYMTLMLIMYLLFTLIVIVKITSIKQGPLRSKN
uniref:NADH-ubiquinone oxidoreductase chain 6 n=1 Tax=Tettigarcta crinita TaxID=295286 RepID=A0A3Q8GAT5_9HEMI|nr:NADH dehydrogenase subunit 6 [Tettigarcta crinita]